MLLMEDKQIFFNMNIFSLKDKVIIVTGASGLLGFEHCKAIASAGGIPILLDLDKNKLESQVKELKKKYNVISSGFCIDITDEKSIKDNCAIILKKYGKIDGLVNNAANNPKMESSDNINFTRLENFPINIWNNDLDVSLKGTFLCIKHYGYQISKNKNGGSIINISSDLGLIAPDQSLYEVEDLDESQQPVKPITYSVVKTGLIGITRYVSTYWAKKNVRVNAICPGGVENNQTSDFVKKLVKKIPLNRMANKNEYQGLIIFLLSSASSYLNGAIISADGGRTAW